MDSHITTQPAAPGVRPRLRGLARGALATLVALTLAIASPAVATASVEQTDKICGTTLVEGGYETSDAPDISAPHAIVVDAGGTVLYERDADTQVKIASITKVMTALVAVENAALTDAVTVDEQAASVGEASAGLAQGDTLTMEDALRALLIPSGNDAALAIAATVGAQMGPSSDDPVAVFVDAMNAKATELGLVDTVFENPHGLDFDEWAGGMHSTTRDVATMCIAAMQNETIRQIVGEGDTEIPVTSADGSERTIKLTDVNQLVGTEGNIGIKTGLTYEAGACFAGVFSRDGKEVYTVILGCEDSDNRGAEEPRFADSLALADWYYDHLVSVPAVTSTKSTSDGLAIAGRASAAAWTDKTVDAVAADPAQQVSYFAFGGPVTVEVDLETFEGEVTVGAPAGTLTYLQDGETIAEVPLVSAEDIEEPSGLAWILVQIDRGLRFITGQPTAAESEQLAQAPTA